MNQVENQWGCLGTILNLLLHVCSSFCFFAVEMVFHYPWTMSFDVLGVSVFIEAYKLPNCVFSLCMAKRSVGMVLAEYLDNQKKGEGKDDIETFLNLVEFPLLNQITPISLFQLHRMISRIGFQFMAAYLWYQLFFHWIFFINRLAIRLWLLWVGAKI